jgi:DNA adenine methylase
MINPYLGEKSKFSQFIVPKIPKNISKYIEPFGGMMGVFFNLDLSEYKDCKFIYNDINWLNYNLFQYLTHKEFNNSIDRININEDFFNWIKNNIFAENNFTELESAIYYAILLNCSKSVFDLKEAQYDGDKLKILKYRLKDNYKYLDRIDEITNSDYIDVIKNHDSVNSFFYIDPPYYGREDYYYNHNFKKESHEELANILSKIKGRFALSYYNFDKLNIYYKDCKIIENKTIMGTEVLIMNYET